MAAKYVVQNCATDLSWAVAGRSHTKLTSLVDDLRAINANRKAPGVVVADSNDLGALATLAHSTKVVVSFAGPFALYDLVRWELTIGMGVHWHKLVRKMELIMRISLEKVLGSFFPGHELILGSVN